MTLLTPGEYDELPQALKDELARVTTQPNRDKKDVSYRKKYGRYLNGEIDADPIALSTVGYGTGDPSAPHFK